ncbi:Levansucrase [Vibrio aerogenes CECT 7868]|uniref:levansucrase n=1 Tax=Vibrio aerogenes CECT 7868 TaxID=1216006 RepID=A0A1M5ZY75_9VIBR|nr:glycoside hydrolase family 68 protein [Vibrio aerogenes]SHI29201.1 Levansucrase [Vibrio aerogenes CECT 7868]
MLLQDKVITTAWSRADALKVKFDDPTTTQPIVDLKFPVMDETLFIWDTMPLKKLDGTIVSVNGWSVIFTLTATREPDVYKNKDGSYDITSDWNARHGRARICYWYAKDGQSWIYGGRVMAEGVSPTAREWAGTPVLINEEGDIELYYTCVSPGAAIAKVRGCITETSDGIKLSDFHSVTKLFSADGFYYQTEEQNIYWNFRDPSPFINPGDGKLYMVFEGNVAGERGTHRITSEDLGNLPPGYEEVGGARYQAGCIGLAVAKDEQGDSWQLLPPLITAVGVNDQTERPHFVFKDGKYYLFTISHQYTYADGLTGPDGVYGFVSDSLFGPYEPLNGSGLVLGNPSSQPFQTYSHCVMPNGLVTSFIDSVPAPEESEYDGDYRIGGTEAPTVQIKIEGNRTFVVKTYDYGFIPPMENIFIQ